MEENTIEIGRYPVQSEEEKQKQDFWVALPEKVVILETKLETLQEHYRGTLKRFDERFATKVKSDSEHEALIRKVCVDASVSESDFKRFMIVSREYNLDPLKKEIYLMSAGGRCSIIISRDGYLKIANNDPSFDGIESDAVYEGDKITKREDTSLLITYGEPHINFVKGKIKGAFCNVYRKDRTKPVSAYVSIEQYDKGSPVWKQYPSAMIIKTAEKEALKRAFALSEDEEGGE